MKDDRGDYGEGAREIGRVAGNRVRTKLGQSAVIPSSCFLALVKLVLKLANKKKLKILLFFKLIIID